MQDLTLEFTAELGDVLLPKLDCLDKLTAAEKDVFMYVLRGFSNKDVATLLRRSPLTVKNQVHAIFTKLDVANRRELSLMYSNARLRGGG